MYTFRRFSPVVGFLFVFFRSYPDLAQSASSSVQIMGFTPSHAVAEQQLEQQFDRLLQPGDLDNWMKRLSAHPHHLGSVYDHRNTLFLDSLFRSWGTKRESTPMKYFSLHLRYASWS